MGVSRTTDGVDAPLLLAPLIGFVRGLRQAGVPLSTSEVVEGMAALRFIDVADRSAVRGALLATLIKRAEDRSVFGMLFDLHFAVRGSRRAMADDAPPGEGGHERTGPREVETSLDRAADTEGAGEDDASTALLEALLDALRRGDEVALRDLAQLAIQQFGGSGSVHGASERYLVHRVLRALELSRLMAQALADERADAGPESIDEGRVRRDLMARIDAFKEMLAAEARLHLAAEATADPAQMGRTATEETDFLGASPRQLAAMRQEIRPLARTLATRMARRRRRRDRGRLDVRRTVRRSLSTGGVPIDPVFRRPKVARPDLYVLCDVSGSVAEFASFTLTLLQAMTNEFPRMRTFAFVDAVDEVSEQLKDVASYLEVRHVLYRAGVVGPDGHSDYGAVLERFWEHHGPSIDSRSTVIITGDARNNRRPPRADALRALHGRARRVYLLDPEPISDWNTNDSIVDVYRPYLDGVFEVRNLRQLAEAVLRIT